MKLVDLLKSFLQRPKPDAVTDDLATLIMAAREDESLRKEISDLVGMPDQQRASLVNTAVEEMKLKGEPASIRGAFSILGTPEGAAAVANALKT